MRGVVRTLIGLACVAAGVLLAGWGLYQLIRVGTCASGGPYVSARECPPGTGGKIVGLMVGIFLTLIGAAITPGFAIKGIAWGLGFTVLGGAFFVAAFGPAAPESDSSLQWVGALVGGMFVLMGLPGLFAVFGAGKGGRRQKGPSPMSAMASAVPEAMASFGSPGVVPVAPSTASTPPTASAAPGFSAPAADDDDTIAELERLAKLRASGALTEAEFQQAKARILEP